MLRRTQKSTAQLVPSGYRSPAQLDAHFPVEADGRDMSLHAAARAGSASDPAESIACRRGASGAACTGTRGVPLWPQDHWQQRARGPERTGVEGSAKGAVSGISDARMEIYRPLKPNGTAVVIFGGGGYFRIQIGSAAKPTAQWLQSLRHRSRGVLPAACRWMGTGFAVPGWPARHAVAARAGRKPAG